MSTTIESVAVAPGRWTNRRSARRLADEAIRTAVSRAGVTTSDIGLLINAGVYRDRILGEPALSALIQEDVGANPEDPHDGLQGTFSFDVSTGGCGPLTALHIADGFLRAGTVSRALIVASDADPGRGLAPDFPYAPYGAAAVCGWTEAPRGLAGFRWENSLEHGDLFKSRVSFEHGHNILRISEDPGFGERAAAVAAKAASGLLADLGTGPREVDLVVAGPLNESFLSALPGFLGVTDDRLVRAASPGQVHTAGLLVALAAADDQGLLRDAHRILLVSAGAGIVAGAALLVQ